MYMEKSATSTVSDLEKKAMQGPITLNIVEEPMEHFTNEDDTFLSNLIREKKKGEGYKAVLLKKDMIDVASTVMGHWYNLHEADMANYLDKNFNTKWEGFDNNNKGEIDYDEGMKFIRDFISGMV